MYLWWSLCTLYLLACQVRVTIGTTNVPLVEFMYLVFTCVPGESYHMHLGSLLLCLCDIFQALTNSHVSWFCTSTLGLVLFHTVTSSWNAYTVTGQLTRGHHLGDVHIHVFPIVVKMDTDDVVLHLRDCGRVPDAIRVASQAFCVHCYCAVEHGKSVQFNSST